MVKRLLLDRLVVAPPFLLLFFFVMNLLEVGAYLQCALCIIMEQTPSPPPFPVYQLLSCGSAPLAGVGL